MLFSFSIFSSLEVLLLVVPALLGVAYVTVAERKTMASMQRRVGPNKVGYMGLLQAFADALKLILKEYVSPTQANLILFFLGPIITLIFSLLGYAVIPCLYILGKCSSGDNSSVGFKLSNSGNLLKLLIPSYIRKNVSGPINYWCRVIIQKISEKIMDNRGSKSDSASLSVKEQRTYGSWCIKQLLIPLRYVLKIFERNLIVKNHSNQLNINKFSTSSLISSKGSINSPLRATRGKKSQILHCNLNSRRNYTSRAINNNIESIKFAVSSWFITGFTDAEGCFSVSVIKSSKYRLGWEVQLTFQIKLHIRDLTLLKAIQAKLGGIGSISSGKNDCTFRVRNLKQILELINFFDVYYLITQKKADYLIFREIALMVQRKEHLTIKGLQKIVNLKASLNLGLSDELKAAYPGISLINRFKVENQIIPHPQWLSGFTSGEGCFSVIFHKDRYKYLSFKITQHIRDRQLMESFINYFKCGYYSLGEERGDFKVTNFSNLKEIIIPFFKENPILGVKALDFQDFCTVALLIETGEHTTEEGSMKISKIKAQMNKGRKIQ